MASEADTEHCKHCGDEIEGEGLNRLTDVSFDDDAAEKEGETQLRAEYGDGPYCSFKCLERHGVIGDGVESDD